MGVLVLGVGRTMLEKGKSLWCVRDGKICLFFFLRNVFVIIYDYEDTAVLHISMFTLHTNPIWISLNVCNVMLAVIKPDPFVQTLQSVSAVSSSVALVMM